MTRKLRDIMSPVPVCMAPTDTVSAAAKAMKEQGVGTALVLASGRLRVLAENRDPLTTHLGEICSDQVAVLGPDDDVTQAEQLVREHAVRRIPILADGIPVGVVSVGDLALEKGERPVLSGVPAAAPGS